LTIRKALGQSKENAQLKLIFGGLPQMLIIYVLQERFKSLETLNQIQNPLDCWFNLVRFDSENRVRLGSLIYASQSTEYYKSYLLFQFD
jgi:hypothetical protein